MNHAPAIISPYRGLRTQNTNTRQLIKRFCLLDLSKGDAISNQLKFQHLCSEEFWPGRIYNDFSDTFIIFQTFWAYLLRQSLEFCGME